MNQISFKASRFKPQAERFLKEQKESIDRLLEKMIDADTRPITVFGIKLPIKRPSREEARTEILSDLFRNPYSSGGYWAMLAETITNCEDDDVLYVKPDVFNWLAELP